MARVRIDHNDLRRVIMGEARRELERSGRLVLNRARILAPVDTGRLRSSLDMRFRRTGTLRPSVQVFSNVDYAAYVNDGTRPHIIRPRNSGGVLRFRMGGRTVYARYVNHPGTEARPFLDRALSEVASQRGYRIVNR